MADPIELDLRRQLAQAKVIEQEAANQGGGDGPIMPEISDLDRRLSVLENEQRNHFRWTVATIIIVFGILATLTTTLFSWLTNRIDRVDDRLGKIEASVSDLPNKINQNLMQLNQTLLQAIIAGATQRPSPPPSPPPNPSPPSPPK
jgi:hypothetical protein